MLQECVSCSNNYFKLSWEFNVSAGSWYYSSYSLTCNYEIFHLKYFCLCSVSTTAKSKHFQWEKYINLLIKTNKQQANRQEKCFDWTTSEWEGKWSVPSPKILNWCVRHMYTSREPLVTFRHKVFVHRHVMFLGHSSLHWLTTHCCIMVWFKVMNSCFFKHGF